jgi:hypothetical protein
VGRLEQVLDAHVTAITAALAGANVTPAGKVVRAWPDQEYLLGIVQANPATGALNAPVVSLYPMGKGKNSSRWTSTRVGVMNDGTPVSLTVTVAGNTATFAGSVAAGINVALFVDAPLRVATYQTISGDTMASTMTALAAKVAALALPGITATAGASSITVTGPYLFCNIGGTGTMLRENGRIDQRIQVTIWTADETQRSNITGVIQSSIGTTDPEGRWIQVGDGTTTWTRADGGIVWKDETIAGAMLKRADMQFQIEFGVVTEETISQVVAFGVTMVEQIQDESATFVAGAAETLP